MKEKSEVFIHFQIYKAFAKLQTSRKVQELRTNSNRRTYQEPAGYGKMKILRSDNGGEYLSPEFKLFFSLAGIKHQLSVLYSLQQNGLAERMNCTLLDMTRSMLQYKDLPEEFVSTAVYIGNRVTSRSLQSSLTPYHRWHGRKPDLSHLRTFGSGFWYISPKAQVRKLDVRGRKAIFMGYPSQIKGYKLWYPVSRKFLVSRDVYFIMEYDQEKSTDYTCTDFQFGLDDASQTDTLSDNVPKNKHTPERDDYNILTSTKDTDTAKENDRNRSNDTGLRRSSRVRQPPERMVDCRSLIGSWRIA